MKDIAKRVSALSMWAAYASEETEEKWYKKTGNSLPREDDLYDMQDAITFLGDEIPTLIKEDKELLTHFKETMAMLKAIHSEASKKNGY